MSTLRLVLYQPDIPQNAGTMLRLAACLGIAVDLVEPAGFLLNDRKLRRAGMDYLDRVSLTRHVSWEAYRAAALPGRLLLMTRWADEPYHEFAFEATDRIMVGQETAGVPPEVAAQATARLRIPMRPDVRSLNVAVAAGMVLGEALRQTGGFVAGGFVAGGLGA
jgi:tRNA (cytidine/uridine-2'-O-)-methyltransferase